MKTLTTLIACLLVGCSTPEPTTRRYEQEAVITTYGPQNEQTGQYRVLSYTIQDMPSHVWFSTPDGFHESRNFRIDLAD